MSTKPIVVYSHARGPNPKKVLIILEELGLPYETIVVDNPKEESFLKINPNGRLPAIKDPNADFTLWESGAIVEYLVETYDKEGKLTLSSSHDKWQLRQYLQFQMSGQGPYYGQAAWFSVFHPEDVPSAKARYKEQIWRVYEVLDSILEGKTYLVGEKLTYADISFVPWNELSKAFLLKDRWDSNEVAEKLPNFAAWHNRLMENPSVKKVMSE